MSSSIDESVTRLASQADAVGRLAQDTGGFSAVISAFESEDPNALRWVLDRLALLPYCELICEWVRVKLCTLRCIRVCGPPVAETHIPSLHEFMEAVVRLSSNEKALRRAVDAVSCEDAEAYHALIGELKLGPFCHLLCQWICTVGYRRVCHLVCRPGAVSVTDTAVELASAGKALSSLLENRKATENIAQAVIHLDCEKLRTAVNEAGLASNCHILCLFLCIWRRVWVCHTLCVEPPPILAGVYAVEEAQQFALATRSLAGQPRVLADLVSAAQSRNVEAYRGIISRFQLGRYCWQMCAWVTSVTCHELCFCVCPPQTNHPWFTHVGDFNIAPGADIDTTTGLTLHPQNAHGGPNFAFYSNLSLGGFCPYADPMTSQPMAYRFLFQASGAPNPTAIAPGYVYGINGSTGVFVGYRQVPWHGNPNALQEMRITGNGTTSPTPPPYTPAPTPPVHYIVPDVNGWIEIDPNALGGVFDGYLLGFDSASAFPAAPAPLVPAGTPVASPANGTNAAIIFQATRVSTIAAVNGGAAPDYTNQLDTIRINNASEVNSPDIAQFVTGCCTPIDQNLGVEFTVDHEEMAAGSWSLKIASCALPSTLDITPTASSLGPPPITVSPRGGYGKVEIDTSAWCNCSYIVTLTTQPGLTDGLLDRPAEPKLVPFAICNHSC